MCQESEKGVSVIKRLETSVIEMYDYKENKRKKKHDLIWATAEIDYRVTLIDL